MITLEKPLLTEQLDELENAIGNTPLIDFSWLSASENVKIFAKAEWRQLGGSVKARPAFNIIKQAILRGELDDSKAILDASSGNTGIAYGEVAKSLGLSVTLCIPENASQKRKDILSALGVNLIYTSPFESTDGSQIEARKLKEDNPERYFYASQYTNDDNWSAHYEHTANEIWEQTNGSLTHFVCGLGTSGTFMGTTRRLKELNPNIQTIGLQPDSPMHGLEGWKHMETAIVPEIYRPEEADALQTVDSQKALDLLKEVAIEFRPFLSPSAAANLLGAIELSATIDEGVLVTVLPDNGDKYDEVLKQLNLI